MPARILRIFLMMIGLFCRCKQVQEQQPAQKTQNPESTKAACHI